jgi:malto-oligosyltrehalose trehalohydrolase
MRKISGARLTATGVAFSLWAPNAKRVDVVIDGNKHPMQPAQNGWFEIELKGLRAGTRYRFRINDETDVPDPASAFQPQDVSGPSEVTDHSAYQWREDGWKGRPWEDVILLETHVGTFTPKGTYRSMVERLDDVVAAGFTAIELMPLADFSGSRNWGYDGVLWSAPDHVYGRPEDLKALIDEAHRRGLMVFLDVVYNHFGPEGNYLGLYAPQFFTDAHTPWGSAIDYARQEVRDFAVENAVAWLRDYRFDGLRLDAVHAILKRGDVPMLNELSRAVGELARQTGRHLHLVLENDDNEAGLLDPAEDPHAGRYRAQWNDDYHHAWHVLLSGENQGYYSDYAPDPGRHLVRILSSGFAYQGEPSPHRDGARRGEPSGALAPTAFLVFLQNHDQIGNRALGERLDALAPRQAVAAALQVTLLAPSIPMLFMGEEWGAGTPFPFFCDFHGELAEAVRNGRRKEFAAAYADHGDQVPDPLDKATFDAAVLRWDERETPQGKERLDLVRRLNDVRKRQIIPRLRGARFGSANISDSGLLTADWQLGDGSRLSLAANLGGNSQQRPSAQGETIWGDNGSQLGPWSVVWQLQARA